MKKWLVTCLLAIALLFVATTAMAGHTKANGEYCLGGSYALLKEYENQHLLRCNDCQEEILENHWIGRRPRAYGKHNAAAVLHASAITGRTTGASGSPTATAPTPASASIMLHTPKRRIVPSAQRPAPYLPPALSAVRFTSWAMTGAHGHPTEIKPTPIPANATPAI